MSDTDLELLITLDDPPYGPEEDRFDHHQSEDLGPAFTRFTGSSEIASIKGG